MTDRETPQAGDARPDPGGGTPDPARSHAGRTGPARVAGRHDARADARPLGTGDVPQVATNAPSSFTAGAIDPVRTGTVRAPVRAPSAARPTADTPAVAAAAPADARAVRDRPARPGRAAKVWATPPLTVAPKPGSPAAARQAGAAGFRRRGALRERPGRRVRRPRRRGFRFRAARPVSRRLGPPTRGRARRGPYGRRRPSRSPADPSFRRSSRQRKTAPRASPGTFPP